MSPFNLNATAVGGCLSTVQRVAIKNALYKLQIQERLDAIQFWGKVYGTQQDYFIAVSTTLNTNVTKRFYYSNDNGVTFARFPALDDFVLRVAPLVPGLFAGNPALKTRDPAVPVKLNEDGQPIDDEDDAADDANLEDKTDPDAPARSPPPRQLLEEERLAFVVSSIDHDCSITPVGYSFLTPTGSIQMDPAFPGLPLARLAGLSSWAHWRDAETAEAKARVRKAAVSNCYDWQDGLVGEWEKGNSDWAVQTEAAGLRASLRSLRWLGWEVQAEAASRDWRQAYFGYGEQNVDLPFMA